MPELRKRKTPPPAPAPAAKKERKPKAKTSSNGDIAKTEAPAPEPEPTLVATDEIKAAEAPTAAKSAKSGPTAVGDTIDLDDFGGEIETHEGEKVTLKALVEKSKAGVVLFTYPKASTPGCTTQACLFRDSFTPLTATGLDIYGLSTDSPKSNTTFKTKQKLPYALLCDKAATLIDAIGFKNGSKTQRGVFVVTKEGKVLAAEPGGPAPTVEVVKSVVAKMGGTNTAGEKKLEKAKKRAGANSDGQGDDEKKADVAAQVADTAAELDK